MNKKQVMQADKLVGKAVGVFSQAIKEVETAQAILTEAVKQDSMRLTALKNEIASIEADQVTKGEKMKANAELLKKLQEFKA